DATAWQGYLVGWLGIATLPPFWFLLAARYARVAVFERRPRLGLSLLVPSAFTWLALASNDAHHLFLRSFTQEQVTRGPLFLVWAAFAYPLVIASGALLASGARRAVDRRDARPRVALCLAGGLAPCVASLLYLAGVLPVRQDPTPAVLALSVLVFTFGIFRMHLIDALPLARRDVVDHLHDGVLIADPEGVVIDANAAALRILAPGGERLVGRDVARLLIEASRASRPATELAAAVLALAPEASLPPVELRTPRDRTLEATAKALPSPDGGVLARVLVLRDRTEERKYERLLRQTQKLETVGSLAAGVAHEVNNPLAFVRANLHQLERL